MLITATTMLSPSTKALGAEQFSPPIEFNIDSHNLQQATLNTNTDTKYIRVSISKKQQEIVKTTDSITINLPDIVASLSINLSGGTGNESITQSGKTATLHFGKELDLSQSTENLDWIISFKITAQNTNTSYPLTISLNHQSESYSLAHLSVLTNTTDILPSGTWILGSGYQNGNLLFPDKIINSLLTQDASDDTNKYATFSNEGPYVSSSAIYNIVGSNKSDNGAVWFKLDANLDLNKIYTWSRTNDVTPTAVTNDVTSRVVFTSTDKREGYIELNSSELQEQALQIGIIAKINDFLPLSGSNKTYHMSLNALYNQNPIYATNKEIYDTILNPNNGKFKPYIQLNYPNNMKLDVNSHFNFSKLATINDIYDDDVTNKVSPTVKKDGQSIDNFDSNNPGDYQFTYAYTNSQGVSSSKSINFSLGKNQVINSTIIAGPNSKWNYMSNITNWWPVTLNYTIDNNDSIQTIDPNIPGLHSVTYSYQDDSSNGSWIDLPPIDVNVVKSKATITTHNTFIKTNSFINPKDNIVQILDAYGNQIPFESDKLSGTVDTSKSGNYTLSYQFEDVAGNTIASQFTITVSDIQLAKVEFIPDNNHNYIVKAINSENKTYPANTTLFLPEINKEYTIGENGTFELANADLPDQSIIGLAYIARPNRSNDVQVTIPAKYIKPTDPIVPENNDNNQAQIQAGLVHYFTDYGVLLWQQTYDGLIPTDQFKPANSYIPYHGDFQIIDDIKYIQLAGYEGSYWMQAQYLLDPATLPETQLTNTKLIAGNVPYGIFLRDTSGNMTSQVIEPGTTWQVYAKKQFYGHTYYRIGNNYQWIEDRYSRLY